MTREKPYIELQDAENDAYYDKKERLRKALKPCPFCGRPGQFDNVGTQTFWVKCTSVIEDNDYCGINATAAGNMQEAAKHWNRRAASGLAAEQLQGLAERVEILQEMIRSWQ